MKKLYLFLIFYLILLGNADATFVSGSTGTDGPLILSNPPQQSEVPWGSVINGSAVEVPLPDSGIFNFTTVNIPSGVTVTFTKNAANTSVYILATGDVTIAGTINVDGESTTSTTGTIPGAGGPGGYDGGFGGATNLPGGKGLGPGGGGGGYNATDSKGGGGGFGAAGGTYGGSASGGPAYGNARMVPLIGGSGGGGSAGFSTSSGYGGGGGGGTIIIASSGTITITGYITANGGDTYGNALYGYAGGGSGGGIRLIANIIAGSGPITAKGGLPSVPNRGGYGRIRIEAYTNSRTAGTDPPYSYGLPSSVFVSNIPSLSITSIAGTNVPANPTGSYAQPDIMLPSTTSNPVAVNVSASNIPVGTSVKVRAIPQYGSENTATSTLSGTNESSTATVSVNLSTTYSNVVTAESTFTIVGMYYDGEEIDRVRVAASMGGRSETTYITKSGKEIKGEMLAMVRK